MRSVPAICLCYDPLFSYTRLANYPCTQTVCLIVDRDDLTEGTLPSAHFCSPPPLSGYTECILSHTFYTHFGDEWTEHINTAIYMQQKQLIVIIYYKH